MSPPTSTQLSHRQNWLSPPIVSRSSSTPALANMMHIPLRMPLKLANEMATSVRLRWAAASVRIEGGGEAVDFESIVAGRSGVRSVVARSTARSAGDDGSDATGSVCSAICVYGKNVSFSVTNTEKVGRTATTKATTAARSNEK